MSPCPFPGDRAPTHPRCQSFPSPVKPSQSPPPSPGPSGAESVSLNLPLLFSLCDPYPFKPHSCLCIIRVWTRFSSSMTFLFSLDVSVTLYRQKWVGGGVAGSFSSLDPHPLSAAPGCLRTGQRCSLDFLSRMAQKHLAPRVCFLHAFWHPGPSSTTFWAITSPSAQMRRLREAGSLQEH